MAALVHLAEPLPTQLNPVATIGEDVPGSGGSPATGELERRICESMRQSQYRQLGHIECRVDQGIATLHGRVNSFYMKQLAQEQASRVDHISRVVNLVEVIYV